MSILLRIIGISLCGIRPVNKISSFSFSSISFDIFSFKSPSPMIISLVSFAYSLTLRNTGSTLSAPFTDIRFPIKPRTTSSFLFFLV